MFQRSLSTIPPELSVQRRKAQRYAITTLRSWVNRKAAFWDILEFKSIFAMTSSRILLVYLPEAGMFVAVATEKGWAFRNAGSITIEIPKKERGKKGGRRRRRKRIYLYNLSNGRLVKTSRIKFGRPLMGFMSHQPSEAITTAMAVGTSSRHRWV
ncbi:hypothetical protein BKA70DRAFT_1238887 [Coprinopsis sp. MPI-PUGE-AT-0042]|nr:hypothetical protein BKA70DRAFT_1238887 [Coprinopsis sp. MPI-PUGE-AT-0042]